MSGNIYIYYEFFKREFLSNLLLSVIASNKNFKVYIGTGKVYQFLLKKNLLKPGIFHTKSITHGSEKTNFHKKLKKKKFMITSIDQEHGVIDSGSFDDLFIKPRVNQKDLELCDAYFCWGNFDFLNLKKKFKKASIFFQTGSPRVDLWKKKFNVVWKNNHVKHNNYILFISNFSICNNYYSFKEIISRKKKEGYYKRSPTLEKEEVRYYKYQKKTMLKFIELIKKISKKFPNRIIYVRPHPTERKDFWSKNLKNLKNVLIKDKKDISNYIHKADVVIQNGCTSAMESYIRQVPIINYLPINSKNQVFGEFIKKIGINLYNEKEILSLIKNKKYKILKKKQNLVDNRMAFLAKELSSEKIVKVWKKLGNENKLTNTLFEKNNNIKIFFFLNIYEFFKSIISTSILFLKNKLYLKKLLEHKSEKIEINKVENNIKNFVKILNIKNSIKIFKLSNNLIYIAKK